MLFFENQRKSKQEIREQVGHQKTRDPVGGRKRLIEEQVIREKERSGSERCRVRDRGVRYWGESDW